jgi:hypothetical protein
MPMEKSTSRAATERNFHDFRHGKTFSRTEKKFGRGKARKQMIAAVMSNKRKAKKRAKTRKSSR